jgi:hypothetical protein
MRAKSQKREHQRDAPELVWQASSLQICRTLKSTLLLLDFPALGPASGCRAQRLLERPVGEHVTNRDTGDTSVFLTFAERPRSRDITPPNAHLFADVS